jgi:hypothetical protein
VIGAGVVAATVLAVLTSSPDNTTPLDPDNAGADGTRAVARVLERNGVEVEVARSAADLEDTAVDAATSVVVVLPDFLGPSTAQRLLEHTAASPNVLVVGVGPSSVDFFDADLELRRTALGEGRAADCSDPLLDGLRIEVDQAFTYGGDGAVGAIGAEAADDCFADDDGAVVTRLRPGLQLVGAEGVLTNDEVRRADNAAVALRLLGTHDRLVWYVPSLSDLAPDDAVTLSSLLPPWVAPGLWVITLAAVALVLWRGRRLGPLSVEPLPVVVRAVETTRSLGWLYRRTGDRAHAANALREATRRRLAMRLGLPGRTDAETTAALLAQVAARSGRSEHEVSRVLDPYRSALAPTDDRALIDLARELDELDRPDSLDREGRRT